jgi:hypothetical protein
MVLQTLRTVTGPYTTLKINSNLISQKTLHIHYKNGPLNAFYGII